VRTALTRGRGDSRVHESHPRKGPKQTTSMAAYLARPHPRCNGYLGIVLREPGRNTSLLEINGHCVQCSHRCAWILIRGKARRANHSPEEELC
jgi:hypothetical protein